MVLIAAMMPARRPKALPASTAPGADEQDGGDCKADPSVSPQSCTYSPWFRVFRQVHPGR
jgi:hypothetical protein